MIVMLIPTALVEHVGENVRGVDLLELNFLT